MSEIERELEDTLHRALDPITARPLPPRREPASGRNFRTVAGGAGAALTVKLLTGVAAAAAAVTVAGAVTTGSMNPVIWGQTVRDTVQSCQSSIANSGQHGIGLCVSTVAKTHGAQVASDARHHGQANGNGNGTGNGHSQGTGDGSGGGKDHKPPVPPVNPTDQNAEHAPAATPHP